MRLMVHRSPCRRPEGRCLWLAHVLDCRRPLGHWMACSRPLRAGCWAHALSLLRAWTMPSGRQGLVRQEVPQREARGLQARRLLGMTSSLGRLSTRQALLLTCMLLCWHPAGMPGVPGQQHGLRLLSQAAPGDFGAGVWAAQVWRQEHL